MSKTNEINKNKSTPGFHQLGSKTRGRSSLKSFNSLQARSFSHICGYNVTELVRKLTLCALRFSAPELKLTSVGGIAEQLVGSQHGLCYCSGASLSRCFPLRTLRADQLKFSHLKITACTKYIRELSESPTKLSVRNTDRSFYKGHSENNPILGFLLQ